MLLDYALRACRGVDGLALTHLDSLAPLGGFRWCERYASLAQLELPRNLAEQASLARAVSAAQPLYTAPADSGALVTPELLCRRLSEVAGVRVKYGASGPRHGDVRLQPMGS